MHIFFIVPALCALLFHQPLAIAADLPAAIQTRYEQLQSFSADFEQTLTHRESGAVEKRKGSMLFAKPLHVRWQTAKPHEELLVVTPSEVWNYLPDEEVAYRYPPGIIGDSHSIVQVLTGQAALTKDFEIKNDGQEGELQKLRLYPKQPQTHMVEAVIWVDPSRAYIRRARIVDFYGNENEVHFLQFTPDAKTRAADFAFTPPAGVDVEDRR